MAVTGRFGKQISFGELPAASFLLAEFGPEKSVRGSFTGWPGVTGD